MAVLGKISGNSVQGIGSSRIGKYSGAFGETMQALQLLQPKKKSA